MSEEKAGQQAENEGPQGGNSQDEKFEPITTQEQLTKLIGDRINKVKSQFADYAELKTKAGQLDALSEASKSEQDKLNDRIAQLEQRASNAELEALRSKYAADIPEKQRVLLTGSTDEELAAQREAILEGIADRKKNGPLSRREGGNPKPGGDDEMRSFTKDLFSSATD